jgi:hypothetical protein
MTLGDCKLLKSLDQVLIVGKGAALSFLKPAAEWRMVRVTIGVAIGYEAHASCYEVCHRLVVVVPIVYGWTRGFNVKRLGARY